MDLRNCCYVWLLLGTQGEPMKEMSKSIHRRLRDPNFITRYFVGNGIDIGGFPDPLNLYLELFPLISSVKIWDLVDGDAQIMDGVDNNSYDFVVSSHCLEHLNDPNIGLKNWIRIIKPGGHLVITIPEEDLYEQQVWPSNKNLDHKWTFTINKVTSWSPNSINVLDLIRNLGSFADIRSIHVEDSGYRFQMPVYDQTVTPIAESAIELIIRKRTQSEIDLKINKSSDGRAVEGQLRKYFNQYNDDYKNLKSLNVGKPPFENESDIK